MAHIAQVSKVAVVDSTENVVQNSGKDCILAEGIDGCIQQVELSVNGCIEAVKDNKGEDDLVGVAVEDSSEKLQAVMSKSVPSGDNNKDCLIEDGKFLLPSKSIQHKKKLNKDFGSIKGILRGRKMGLLGESDGFT
ncbi:hypothetical protein MA16_Dca010319 [Dendrobium catenatum]|uniref:Uncharacterized protein n=1 Tax=Dendrobium catenatum TaxID=906689 RepID=A0A2I0W3H6_9ASPA|nr:hypothetical protein MA16_Dca010319 [Dendrobium catenatum]